jgi:class 3 adenylate cyclase
MRNDGRDIAQDVYVQVKSQVGSFSLNKGLIMSLTPTFLSGNLRLERAASNPAAIEREDANIGAVQRLQAALVELGLALPRGNLQPESPDVENGPWSIRSICTLAKFDRTNFKQRLAAILAADVAGYSRLMADDEQGTIAALDVARAVFRRHIEANQGRVVDMAGDSVLAVFESATGAVTAALVIQETLTATRSSGAEGRRMHFRIGVHIGDVIEKTDGTVYGDGVNIAARLQALAGPQQVAVSDAVKAALRGKANAIFEDQGEHTVKNIAEPLRVFRMISSPSTTAQRSTESWMASSRVAVQFLVDAEHP